MTTADRSVFRADVRDWQAQMRNRGWRISVDGRFGPQSAGVAARFAAMKGLAAARGTVDAAAFTAAWTMPTR
jgi:peptidoglycan hydrolase-like protein with peptidoglycan-binding domain